MAEAAYVRDEVLDDSIFGDEEFEVEQVEKREIDPFYGKGRWPKAILREVTAQAANEYGHSFITKLDLKGDEGMPFTFFIELPIKPVEDGGVDDYERRQKRYQVQLNKLKTLVHATGHWVDGSIRQWPKSLNDFSDGESANKLELLLQTLIGRNLGVNVKIDTYTKRNGEQAYRKNVWGLEPKGEKLPF